MNYTIQNNKIYFWTGRDQDHKQIIMGLLAPYVVVYSFNPDGSYHKRELIQLAHPPRRDAESGVYDLNSQFMTRFSGELDEVKRQIGYQPDSVSIQEFFDPAQYVGVSSLPSDYQEFLDYPDRFAEEEKQAYESHITQWKNDGNFVFCWAEEYWMNKNGEIESS